MASGRGCFALAVLLAIVDVQLGGCMDLLSSVSQEGNQLSIICTLWHKKEEAEGIVVFLCKDTSVCSPETSLEQLILTSYPETDGISERTSNLTFTINQATPSASGTYQCCARSRKPEILLQGHFFSILVTETGNYTEMRRKKKGHHEFSHSRGARSSHFLQEIWVLMVTSLVALQDQVTKLTRDTNDEQVFCVSVLRQLMTDFQGDHWLAPSPIPPLLDLLQITLPTSAVRHNAYVL